MRCIKHLLQELQNATSLHRKFSIYFINLIYYFIFIFVYYLQFI